MLVNKRVDLLEKGFQLAHFLIPDRAIAIQILGAAMSKLKAQRSRETKRAYWRDKYLKRKITRIARNDGDLLQWLIYFEAEDYEKRQEQAGEQTTRDMVIRYIKYLVQMTTAMSSFYVNVGLHRLLHNYSTAEVQKVYESVTQHYPGDQEYRKVKATLMNKLQTRFNNFLRTCTAHYGESRFEVSEHQDSWAELVDRCLRAFTPWSTAQTCDVLANLDSGTGLPFPLSGKVEGGSVDQDMVETYRCHVFTEPSCFSWLTKRFGLDPPRARLAVPQFFVKQTIDSHKNSGNGTETTAELTEEERNAIMSRLTAEAARRRRISVKSLRISADGKECVRLVSGERNIGRFEIEEGTKLIEIWAQDQSENLLLATHWVKYTEWEGIAPSTATLDLGSGSELLLQVIPNGETTADHGSAAILVKWGPVSRFAAWQASLRNPPRWLHSLPRYALAPLLLLAVGGIVGTLEYSRQLHRQQTASERLREELAREKAARAALEHAIEVKPSAPPESYLLVPNDLLIRGPHGRKEPIVSLAPHASLVIFELPIAGGHEHSYRAVLKAFLDDREIIAETFPLRTLSLDKLNFAVPAIFLEDGKHYVISLNSIEAPGKMTEVRKFTFFVKKN